MEKSKVINLATDVAKHIGIPVTSPELILKKMSGKCPTATILRSAKHTMWIDAQYIAIDELGIPGVLYIYVARHHVTEELRDVVLLRECSEKFEDHYLYDNIAQQLVVAKKHMAATGTDYFLNKNYLESIKRGASTSKNKITDKDKPQVLTLTLCHKCKADFENSGYVAVRKGWPQEKERCDFCTVGRGMTYGLFHKKDHTTNSV